MSYYAVTKPGERPRLFIEAGTQEAADLRCGEGEIAIATDRMDDYVASADGLALLPFPFPLPILKLRRWNAVKALRSAKVAAGVAVAGIGRFDIDAESRAAIAAEALGLTADSAAGQAMTVQWKMRDNVVVADIAAADFIAAAQAIRLHYRAIHYRAQQLGLAIDAAADAGELGAIDIESGWPA